MSLSHSPEQLIRLANHLALKDAELGGESPLRTIGWEQQRRVDGALMTAAALQGEAERLLSKAEAVSRKRDEALEELEHLVQESYSLLSRNGEEGGMLEDLGLSD
ncbi:MAG: hypothetical protein AAGJ31_12765 [Verrucomicrobiota bacterium]